MLVFAWNKAFDGFEWSFWRLKDLPLLWFFGYFSAIDSSCVSAKNSFIIAGFFMFMPLSNRDILDDYLERSFANLVAYCSVSLSYAFLLSSFGFATA